MKVNFLLVVNLFFFLCSYSDLSGNEIQKPGATLNIKTDSTRVTKLDSIAGYSIHINGQLNAVSITNNPSTPKHSDDQQKKTSNSIDINGEGNSVTIHQNKNAGQVTIQQNGKGNQVTVSQTNSGK